MIQGEKGDFGLVGQMGAAAVYEMDSAANHCSLVSVEHTS
jgi:hypothetical protein